MLDFDFEDIDGFLGCYHGLLQVHRLRSAFFSKKLTPALPPPPLPAPPSSLRRLPDPTSGAAVAAAPTSGAAAAPTSGAISPPPNHHPWPNLWRRRRP
ncbi:hypothetical protein TRIUR3_34574 [Triticum urartu]|uniref:Uncharacterized protein n=1 Tax=Triticum urartu TaxID=4572 RepID=M7Y8M6_TRIUA|nr:hypothetical protein TRIUR3_34574 [Triticum urartu]